MNLAQYHSRSPRYILQPQDNTMIRVSGPRQAAWEEGTEIVNISMTGLAFTAPIDLCPIIGETIKIQFSIPGSKQMACYGLVTRLETLGRVEMLVGIQFQKLEMAHRIVLLQGLAQKLKEQQQRKQKEELKKVPLRLLAKWPAALAMFGTVIIWAAVVYYWTNSDWLKSLAAFLN